VKEGEDPCMNLVTRQSLVVNFIMWFFYHW